MPRGTSATSSAVRRRLIAREVWHLREPPGPRVGQVQPVMAARTDGELARDVRRTQADLFARGQAVDAVEHRAERAADRAGSWTAGWSRRDVGADAAAGAEEELAGGHGCYLRHRQSALRANLIVGSKKDGGRERNSNTSCAGS